MMRNQDAYTQAKYLDAVDKLTVARDQLELADRLAQLLADYFQDYLVGNARAEFPLWEALHQYREARKPR